MSRGKSGDVAKGAGSGWDEEPGMGKAMTSRRGRDKKIHIFSLYQLRLQVKLSKGRMCQNQNYCSALTQSLCKCLPWDTALIRVCAFLFTDNWQNRVERAKKPSSPPPSWRHDQLCICHSSCTLDRHVLRSLQKCPQHLALCLSAFTVRKFLLISYL